MFKLEIDYPTSSRNAPRYTRGRTNQYVDAALARNNDAYRGLLELFRKYVPKLSLIAVNKVPGSTQPAFRNDFLPGLDCVALYCLLAELRPRLYIEVGSGNSTQFARRSITDNKLSTRIVSVDPYPRVEINAICDEVIRTPVEDVDLGILDRLESGDILFIDNSHRCFMNSDVTVCFVDMMPRLKKGVYLHIHDIFWPEDYPASWQGRYYNEQYMLGALLANGLHNYEVVLPNYHVSLDPELSKVAGLLWGSNERFNEVERHGCSFWMRKL